MKNSISFRWLVGLVLGAMIVSGGVYSYFSQSPKNELAHLPLKSENIDISEVVDTQNPGWKKYHHKKALFTIEFPDHLKVIDEYIPSEGNSSHFIGRTFFCNTDVDQADGLCSEGFTIAYGRPDGDGWGGGCDLKDSGSATIAGTTLKVCRSEAYISQLYLIHPDLILKYTISSYFGPSFTQVEAEQMLKTFVFERSTLKE